MINPAFVEEPAVVKVPLIVPDEFKLPEPVILRFASMIEVTFTKPFSLPVSPLPMSTVP